MNWQKSTYSGYDGECIEVSTVSSDIFIRESDISWENIMTTPENFRKFIQGVKAGEFDHFCEDK